MPPVNILIKPASSACNMACTYCFYKDVAEHREQAFEGMLTLDQMERVISAGMEYAEHICSFAFQGGEPTLAGLEFYRGVVELQKKYQRQGVEIHNAIQTNGYLIDEEWAEFLKKHHFLTGISMDGIQEIHDRNRKDAKGKETFKKVLKNAGLLQKEGVDVNILCVLTKQSARKIHSIYNFLKKEGFYYHQYIPCLDPLGEERGGRPWSLTPEDYGNALKELFDLWYRDMLEEHPVSIREFDNWLAMLGGNPPEACAQMGRCSMQNIVEANGDVFPCDFYVLDQYRAGNVREKDFRFFREDLSQMEFLTEGKGRGKACPSCPWYPLCRGGCRRDYTEEGENYFCRAYQEFFQYAIERLEKLAARTFGF